ncbi:hypothetical protein K470DRAFT_208266 [Piedraia hortae CBS 480.64]|uniref:NADH-ubiquinone oxidoreductase 299 kDa subunit n=1 Tax=Piedraia hortae CBS 480.64 TaxID=1314780 RepID=A0A6A7CBR1_9PEZI|nr:hypothetical protein K470DRAFT_208266 [Piedraia hortae CBS 480.64]
MRPAARLLATLRTSSGRAASAAHYLEAGAPTGLTGIYTHPAPRSALLYVYNQTLQKLSKLPESSVYRQATEALTRERLRAVESKRPEGLREWQERVKSSVELNPETFSKVYISSNPKGEDYNIVWDLRDEEPAMDEKLSEEEAAHVKELTTVQIEPEPALTAEQISELEKEIGGGLIEEVILAAKAECDLVDTMAEERVWEDLVEKPVEGQWTYFERGRHTA